LTSIINSQFDPALSWGEISWLQEQWEGPIVLKGVLRGEDARQAIRLGVRGVIVSNHGGRQLDHAPSAISALPVVVDAVGGEIEVYMDGGIRRGVDIIKALALGARACLSGRALVYGLGAGGEAGAARAMNLLVEELRLAMTLAGCGSVRELDRSWVTRIPENERSEAWSMG
jgi:L-lactate dehydrogenase (cytochrome)